MALKAQRGLNRRLELWRDCAERAFLVGGDTAVGWRSGRLGAWGGWTALIGGQHGYRNKEEMWGLKSTKGIGLNLSLLSPSFGSNRKFPSSNRKSSGAFSS